MPRAAPSGRDMAYKGDVSPGFHQALHELSDEVACSALGTWSSLVEETMHPAHHSGDVWSCLFEADDRWNCLLVGIGQHGNTRYLVALRVVVDASDTVPALEIEEAQAEWDGWRSARTRDILGRRDPGGRPIPLRPQPPSPA
jgi:hypothetical protein